MRKSVFTWLLVSVLPPSFAFAQQLVFIGDTSIVKTSVIDGDTDYCIGRALKQDGKYIIYYDSAYQRKTYEAEYEKWNIRAAQSWYRNGALKSEMHIIENLPVRDFEMKKWYPGGQLRYERVYKNDSIVNTRYYEDGPISSKTVELFDTSKKIMVPDLSMGWYENGQIKYTPFRYNTSDTQLVFNYYPDGKISGQFTWQRYGYIGEYKEWYRNGRLKVMGYYGDHLQNGRIIPFNVSGLWTYYNEDGSKKSEVMHKEDGIVITRLFERNIKVREETRGTDGCVRWKTFDRKGKVLNEGGDC